MTTYRHPCTDCRRPGTRTFHGFAMCPEHYADRVAEAFRGRHVIVAIEAPDGKLTCESCELPVYGYARGHRHDLDAFRRIEREGRFVDWSPTEVAEAFGR